MNAMKAMHLILRLTQLWVCIKLFLIYNAFKSVLEKRKSSYSMDDAISC